MDEEHRNSVAIAELTTEIRAMDRRHTEHADAMREMVQGVRDDVKADMQEIRTTIARDVGRIADDMGALRETMEDPHTGIIRTQQNHAERILALENVVKRIKGALIKIAWFAGLGVLAFIGTALLRYAEEIGHWITQVKSPPGTGGQ